MVVTASVGKVAFQKAILGDIVKLSKISRAFTSSMEVVMDVWVKNVTGEKDDMKQFTFVAVDQLGRPIEFQN